MQARDVMTANVISVREAAPIHEVVGLLLKHRISAVPVVDAAQRVVGIVSEGDLPPRGRHRRRETAALVARGHHFRSDRVL